MKRKEIAKVSELAEGASLKFDFEREGLKREGFVIRHEGTIVAYENLCRHIPLSIDYADNRFFTADGKHLICRTHGAIYEPLTGLCVRGPCEGSSLISLPIQIMEGTIWLCLPEETG